MCGIAGIVVERPTDAGAEGLRDAALCMARALAHRGPDGIDGHLSPSGRCALGHSRLKVIDLETGDQPMPNEDGSLQLVFNGEIYNFRELRTRLKARGHRFRSTGDTEVIVHGYEEWGDAVVERLDGMFAFGLWDEPRGRLLLARDRAGKKPLFLYREEGRFAFASEIEALLSLPGVDDVLDPRALPLYLAYGYVPAPGTFYRRIGKLPPGHLLALEEDGSERIERYWRLDASPAPDPGEGEAARRLRERMVDAVRRRLVADVPLGAFLSGGVDSSVVVGLMSELVDEPVRTFSIGFEDAPGYDETRFARIAAERFGTDHTSFRVGAQSVDLVERLVAAYDEPFGDSSAIPTYIVSGLTREHVTVALTGDGGDELFAGYARFQGMRIAAALPGWAIGLGGALAGALPHDPDFRSLPRRAQRFFEAAALPEEERMLRWIGFFADRLDELLRAEHREILSRDEVTRSFRRPLRGREDLSVLARTLALNFETYLPEDLLVKADRCSMAHGLELRSPFLDTALVEFAAGLPDRYKIRGRTYKRLLKRAFRDLLPDEIIEREKMGFGIPLPAWFRGPWRPLLEERVLADDARIWEWIRPGPVREMVAAHMEERADFGHQLWALLTLEEWLRRGRFSLPG
ncbi:MAG TPA: asparagine synthase (glutamine-hydrolyzing) [Longimicrobiales bacterium]|nr:asparagine synthase (glutamine-hydrolyzing) [Longimicrobiales bacterium]